MQHDLESQAAARVGQLILAFARVDFLLSLALRNLISMAPSDFITPLVERLGFKEKLDALREIVPRAFSTSPPVVAEYERWYASADRLRITRNAFVHGRWGMQSRDTVFNASTKVGEALSGAAQFYSLTDLDQKVLAADAVLKDFSDWHSRHVVDSAGS